MIKVASPLFLSADRCIAWLTHTTGPAEEVTEDMLRDAQDELLHARASYSLTNSAIENVLVVNPILRAVHSATEASPVER